MPYWFTPYAKLNLPDALVGPGLVAVCAGAFLLRAFRLAPFWSIARILGAALPAVVMVRVLVECVQDPTRHNLWPLELIIAVVMGVAASFAGALAGAVLDRLLRGREDGQAS